jgi:hypothetical protein
LSGCFVSASTLSVRCQAELLHVLLLPDFDRAGRIGEFFQDPRTRGFAELLIDAEEDKYVRAVLIPMPRETERCDG